MRRSNSAEAIRELAFRIERQILKNDRALNRVAEIPPRNYNQTADERFFGRTK